MTDEMARAEDARFAVAPSAKGELLALADRCEALNADSSVLDARTLDKAIHVAMFGAPTSRLDPGLPRYTTSLDAAASLVPEGAEYSLTNLYGVAHAECPLNASDIGWQDGRHEGGLMAPALCAAALRARASNG